MTDHESATYNLVGAARLVKVTPSTVRYWIMSGQLAASLVRGHWVIKEHDLIECDKTVKTKTRAGKRGPRGIFVRANPFTN